MRLLIFFVLTLSGFANAAETPVPRCDDIFLEEEDLQNLLDKNYFSHPGISDLMERLQKLGVRFDFWDPTEMGTVTMLHRYVEPLIVSGFYDHRFIAEQTTIYLPYEPKHLFGRQDSHYRTRQVLIRIARIFELQKQGILFSSGSLDYNARITIVGFTPILKLEDPTLVAIHHLFTNFRYRRVSFEPRESVWEYFDFSPERNYVTSPQDEYEMLIRISYFDRKELWDVLSHDLEEYVFKPERQSLFPTSGHRMN